MYKVRLGQMETVILVNRDKKEYFKSCHLTGELNEHYT